MNKKGYYHVIAIILALTILGMFLLNVAQRECNNNHDCPENSYCGSDYECYEYPQEIVVQKNNFLPAAIILGLSLIIAAYVFKRNKLKK